MKKICTIALALFMLQSGFCQADDGWKVLFDGKSLKGWEGKEKFWSVEDGAITGQTTKDNPTKGNTFLVWKDGKTADFELHVKFKIVGGNSGIQYRSENVGDFVVKGYQADIDTGGHRFMGILYGERTGRGIIAERGKAVVISEDNKKEVTGSTLDEKKFLAAIKSEDWNQYVIIAKGNRLIHKINGFTTCDVTDNEKRAVKSGILAFQVHAGPPMKVQFKDIKMKVLK